jgi:predicted MPP superfamily phosphohydrolase
LLAGLVAAMPFAAGIQARFIEPGWIKVRRVRLGNSRSPRRLVHITDIHYRGDRGYLESAVRRINGLAPNLVCFTGDLIEEVGRLPEALEILGGIKAAVYGVPGNHDFWSKASFEPIARCFAATGGRWLMDDQVEVADGGICLTGASSLTFRKGLPPIRPGMRNVLLMHYPAWVDQLDGARYDLILAGHSHGGQVRIPFLGALYVPFGVERYDMGLFQTESGPMCVNPGLGWFPIPVRFNCRPEITLFEL